jgi:lactate permease
MGKMIDAQSIMVACAACYDEPKERAHALGPIFRTVWWHSIAGAAVIGIIAMLQAYVFPGVIPVPPPPPAPAATAPAPGTPPVPKPAPPPGK